MARFADSKLVLTVIMLMVLAPTPGTIARCTSPFTPKKLILYAHENEVDGDADETIIKSVAPGNQTVLEGFGTLKTVSNILRESTANDSTIYGSQVGLVAVGLHSKSIYFSFTYYLNENATSLGQGTIAVHGHMESQSIVVERVFAVVGGTGDFVGVFGYDSSPWADDANPADPYNMVNKHTLTLYYPY